MTPAVFFNQGGHNPITIVLRYLSPSEIHHANLINRKCREEATRLLALLADSYPKNYPHHVKAGTPAPKTYPEWKHIESIKTCDSLDAVLSEVEKFAESLKPNQLAKFFCQMPYNPDSRISILVGNEALDLSNPLSSPPSTMKHPLVTRVLLTESLGMNMPLGSCVMEHFLNQTESSTYYKKRLFRSDPKFHYVKTTKIDVTLPVNSALLDTLRVNYPEQVAQWEGIAQNPNLSTTQKKVALRELIVDNPNFLVRAILLEKPESKATFNQIRTLMAAAQQNLENSIVPAGNERKSITDMHFLPNRSYFNFHVVVDGVDVV